MSLDKQFHYYVLFTQTVKQEKLKLALENTFPKYRGKVLLPSMEWWRRGKNELSIKYLFPGYIFIHSDMSIQEIHEFISKSRLNVTAIIKELGIYERKISGKDMPETDNKCNREYEIRDLTQEETEFFDHMLDTEGVIRMSSGYCEGDKFFIMNGPLQFYKERITDVDKHNRMAYLDFKTLGRVAKAGLEILPKRHWFPDSKKIYAMLVDGTELDIQGLKNRMMGG